MAYNKIDNKKLNVRKTIKHGNSIYLPLTGWLEEDNKYIVEKKSENRKLNGEDKIITQIIIQSVEDAKSICQNWNEIECKQCEEFDKCELI